MANPDTRLDRFGRIVLPKSVRDDYGLTPGSILEVCEVAEGILLRPAPADWPLVVREGVLVYAGKATADPEDVVAKERERRIRKFWPRRRS